MDEREQEKKKETTEEPRQGEESPSPSSREGVGLVRSFLSGVVRSIKEAVPKAVVDSGGGPKVEDGGRESYQANLFAKTVAEGIKRQNAILGEISASLKKISSTLVYIRKTLKDWYERRNQLSLRDLLRLFGAVSLGAFRQFSDLARGAGSLLRDLLLHRLLGRGILGRGTGRIPRTGRGFFGRLFRRVGTTRGLVIEVGGRRIARIVKPEPGKPVFPRAPMAPVPIPTQAPKPQPQRGLPRAREVLGRSATFLREVGTRVSRVPEGLLRGLSQAGSIATRGLARVLPVASLFLLGKDFVENLIEVRKLTGEGIGGALKAGLASALSTLSLGIVPPEVSASLVSKFTEWVSGVFGKAREKASELASKVSSFFQDSFLPVFISTKDSVVRSFSSVKERISEVASGLVDSISSVLSSIREKISSLPIVEWISHLSNSIKDSISSVSSLASEKISNALSSIGLFFDSVKDFFEERIKGIGSSLSNLGKGVGDRLRGFGEGVVNFGKGVMDRLFGKPKEPGGGGVRGFNEKMQDPPVVGTAARPREPGSYQTLGPVAKSELSEIYEKVIVPSVGRHSITQLIGQNRPFVDPATGKVVNPMGYGRHGHMGIDVATPQGTPVRAPFDGVVVDASGGAWGRSVYLVGKNLAVRFSHLSEISVPSGTYVKEGQVIAKTGNTGNSTGPHLDITFYTANGGKVGTWIANYEAINRLVSSEITNTPLSAREVEEIRSKAKASSVSASSTFDTGQVPISSPFGLFVNQVAQAAGNLLGLDAQGVISSIQKRISDFADYLYRNSGMVDIRHIERRMNEIIGTPKRFQSKPYIEGVTYTSQANVKLGTPTLAPRPNVPPPPRPKAPATARPATPATPKPPIQASPPKKEGTQETSPQVKGTVETTGKSYTTPPTRPEDVGVGKTFYVPTVTTKTTPEGKEAKKRSVLMLLTSDLEANRQQGLRTLASLVARGELTEEEASELVKEAERIRSGKGAKATPASTLKPPPTPKPSGQEGGIGERRGETPPQGQVVGERGGEGGQKSGEKEAKVNQVPPVSPITPKTSMKSPEVKVPEVKVVVPQQAPQVFPYQVPRQTTSPNSLETLILINTLVNR